MTGNLESLSWRCTSSSSVRSAGDPGLYSPSRPSAPVRRLETLFLPPILRTAATAAHFTSSTGRARHGHQELGGDSTDQRRGLTVIGDEARADGFRVIVGAP